MVVRERLHTLDLGDDLSAEAGKSSGRLTQTAKYRLGLGILELAGVALGQMDLRQVAAPLQRQLSIAARETAPAISRQLGARDYSPGNHTYA